MRLGPQWYLGTGTLGPDLKEDCDTLRIIGPPSKAVFARGDVLGERGGCSSPLKVGFVGSASRPPLARWYEI